MTINLIRHWSSFDTALVVSGDSDLSAAIRQSGGGSITSELWWRFRPSGFPGNSPMSLMLGSESGAASCGKAVYRSVLRQSTEPSLSPRTDGFRPATRPCSHDTINRSDRRHGTRLRLPHIHIVLNARRDGHSRVCPHLPRPRLTGEALDEEHPFTVSKRRFSLPLRSRGPSGLDNDRPRREPRWPMLRTAKHQDTVRIAGRNRDTHAPARAIDRADPSLAAGYTRFMGVPYSGDGTTACVDGGRMSGRVHALR